MEFPPGTTGGATESPSPRSPHVGDETRLTERSVKKLFILRQSPCCEPANDQESPSILVGYKWLDHIDKHDVYLYPMIKVTLIGWIYRQYPTMICCKRESKQSHCEWLITDNSHKCWIVWIGKRKWCTLSMPASIIQHTISQWMLCCCTWHLPFCIWIIPLGSWWKKLGCSSQSVRIFDAFLRVIARQWLIKIL